MNYLYTFPQTGTNRVIDACTQYGIDPPTFEETAGAVVVTFRVPITVGAETRHQVGTKLALSEHQVQVLDIARNSKPIQDLMQACQRSDRTKFRNQVIRPLLYACADLNSVS